MIKYNLNDRYRQATGKTLSSIIEALDGRKLTSTELREISTALEMLEGLVNRIK